MAGLFGEAYILRSDITQDILEAWPERIAAVTAAQVNAAARAVLIEAYSVTSVLLPKKKGG